MHEACVCIIFLQMYTLCCALIFANNLRHKLSSIQLYDKKKDEAKQIKKTYMHLIRSHV